MKKTLIKYTVAIVALFLISLFAPHGVQAASVYVSSSNNNVRVGDTFIVTVSVDSDQTAINSVEGDITFEASQNNFEVKEFSLAGSIFGLWPRTPSITDGKIISFVGGVPGGFDIQGAKLFNIIVEAKKEGSIKISPRDIIAYANDGQGSKVPVTIKDLTINVEPRAEGVLAKNDWSAVVSADTTPPEEFVIILGKEDTLFDGKKFAFFSALDGDSGISYYEVSENGGAPVRSGSTYVLQNQDASKVKLQVTAYDKAGNKRLATYESPTFGLFGLSWSFYIIVIILLVLWYVLRRRRMMKVRGEMSDVENNVR